MSFNNESPKILTLFLPSVNGLIKSAPSLLWIFAGSYANELIPKIFPLYKINNKKKKWCNKLTGHLYRICCEINALEINILDVTTNGLNKQ